MRKEVKTIEEAETLVESLHNESKYIIEVLTLPEDIGYAVQWQEHKNYTSLDGKEWPDEVWRTENGCLLQIQDIEPEHCRNILRMILRQNREAESHLKDLSNVLLEAIADLTNDSVDPNNKALLSDSDDKPTIH